MLKPRVGDLVRYRDQHGFYRVSNVCPDRVEFTRKDGLMGYVPPIDIVEVIRPAKRRTLTKKQAREWLSGQQGWYTTENHAGHQAGCNGWTTMFYPTFTAAVIALRKKMGVK